MLPFPPNEWARTNLSSAGRIQGDEALLAQHLDSRQTCFAYGNSRDFDIAQQEFACNLLDRESVCTKVQQLSGKRSELANFRRPRWYAANCQFHLLARYVMQGPSLPEPPENLMIVSRKLNDLYSRKQAQAAVRGKQVVTVLEHRFTGNLLLTVAAIA